MTRLLAGLALLAFLLSGCHDETPDGGTPLPFISDLLRADAGCDWAQWGQNWAHTGASCLPAQGFGTALASITFDPFVPQEVAEGDGDLFAHYATPLVVGDDLYMEVKAGTYVPCVPPGSGTPVPCGFDAWDQQVWTVQHHAWISGTLTLQGTYVSDWKPPPASVVKGWEPVFQPAVHDQTVWVPAAGGTVVHLDRQLGGAQVVNPFTSVQSSRYVTGPLVVDADGTLLYNVVELDPADPENGDAQGYLVRVPPTGAPSKVLYQSIVSGAPASASSCPYTYPAFNIPGPYPATVPVPTGPCGSQRPGWNSAPAIGPGGVIFVVSRTHYGPNDTFLVALKSDLTPKWTFRMRELLSDGCGVNFSCRQGAPTGVDPLTGLKPSIWISDEGSSVPVALPDGAVLYGGYTFYNGARGHLVKVSPDGQLMGTYDFGWDVTPAVWVHAGTYSIITKDNHYAVSGRPEGPYDMTQLSRDLAPEWKFPSTETRDCITESDGGVTCTTGQHPNGFEWCVNAPAVGPDGTVYANSEDGRVYSIRQGGTLGERRFLLESLGAAYTPIAVDSKGRVYSMNGGTMTVVGQ